MITNTQSILLDDALDGVDIPGMDANVGNNLSTSSLKSYTTLTTNPHAPIYYNPAENKVIITGNGLVVSGYNFTGATVVVDANNVTVKNCTFGDAFVGYDDLTQTAGYSGMTVTNNTFNGGDNTLLAEFVNGGSGYAVVSENKFLNAPSHDVSVEDGIVSNNYFSGGGFSIGAHADAISVLTTTGPVMISGNYIDWTNDPNATPTGNAIRITTELGNTSNVTVEDNVLMGGEFTVYANVTGATKGVFSNINIENTVGLKCQTDQEDLRASLQVSCTQLE
jgi:hypothetical protein